MFSFPPLTPFVKKLLITLITAFVVELLLQNFAKLDVISLLALDPVNLSPLSPLQLVGYVLIADPRAVMSLLIGLLFMWLILSPFESLFGPVRTAQLTLVGVAGAGLATVAAAAVAPIPGYLLLGSHPIAYAGMAAMTQVMRNQRILFFGVLPMTASQLLLVLVGLSLLEFLASRDHLSLAASLGAIGAGIGYVRFIARGPRPPRRRSGGSPRFRVLRGGAAPDSDRPKWLN